MGVYVGVGVGAGAGSGVYGPLAGELRQTTLQPSLFPARAPTMYVLELSALNVMLVSVWLKAARYQLWPPLVV